MKLNFKPVASQILSDRLESTLLLGAALIQLGAVYFGLPGWPCPFKAFTGLPCPGCYLSTAMQAFIQGDFQRSLSIHAFTPIVFVMFVVLLVTYISPAPLRSVIVNKINFIECRFGIVYIILIGLMVYWVLRLLGSF